MILSDRIIPVTTTFPIISGCHILTYFSKASSDVLAFRYLSLPCSVLPLYPLSHQPARRSPIPTAIHSLCIMFLTHVCLPPLDLELLETNIFLLVLVFHPWTTASCTEIIKTEWQRLLISFHSSAVIYQNHSFHYWSIF